MGVTGCLDTARNTIDSATGTHGPQKEFGFGSPGFESAGWTEDGMFEVTFDDDHDMDGWGVRYHAKSNANDDIVLREAPTYGGADTIDLLAELAGSRGRPPAGEYHIIAYSGAFSNRGISIIGEELGSVSFHIEPALTAESATMTANHHLTANVENSGNSPCFIQSVSVQSAETPVGQRVHYNETKELKSSSMIYPQAPDDPDCIQLLEDFVVRFNTVPRTDLSIEMSEGHEYEQSCTIEF